MLFIYKVFVTALGFGYSPIAPGTCGAIFGCAVLWSLEKYNLISTSTTPLLFAGLIVVISILAIIASSALESEWGKDPSKIVIDEVIGMWITMLFIPLSWINLTIGFVLFRFFDIAKPLGIRKLEKLPSGVGVVADDMLAGIYANICLLTITFLW